MIQLIQLLFFVAFASAATTFRFAFITYNANSGPVTDINAKFSATQEALSGLQGDFVSLQGVEPLGAANMKTLANMLGYNHYVFQPHYITAVGNEQGIVILTNYSIVDQQFLHFSPDGVSKNLQTDCNLQYNASADITYCAGALAIRFQLADGNTLWLVNAQIRTADPGAQTIQITSLQDWLVGSFLPYPTIITGSFNANPSSPAVVTFTLGLVDNGVADSWQTCGNVATGGNTYPSNDPQQRLDYIYFGGKFDPTQSTANFACEDATVFNNLGSNSLPFRTILKGQAPDVPKPAAGSEPITSSSNMATLILVPFFIPFMVICCVWSTKVIVTRVMCPNRGKYKAHIPEDDEHENLQRFKRKELYDSQSPAPPPSGGYPPQSYPPQSYPPQSYPPQSYPPQSYPPQSYQQPAPPARQPTRPPTPPPMAPPMAPPTSSGKKPPPPPTGSKRPPPREQRRTDDDDDGRRSESRDRYSDRGSDRGDRDSRRGRGRRDDYDDDDRGDDDRGRNGKDRRKK